MDIGSGLRGYRINGILCTDHVSGNGLLPSSHHVGYTQHNEHETIWGTVVTEPVSGTKRVHTWHYNGRPTTAIAVLLGLLGSSPLAIIDTFGTERNYLGEDLLYTNVEVTWKRPEFESAEQRGWVKPFSIIFTEIYPI